MALINKLINAKNHMLHVGHNHALNALLHAGGQAKGIVWMHSCMGHNMHYDAIKQEQQNPAWTCSNAHTHWHGAMRTMSGIHDVRKVL